jgi:hypothetical protein
MSRRKGTPRTVGGQARPTEDAFIEAIGSEEGLE